MIWLFITGLLSGIIGGMGIGGGTVLIPVLSLLFDMPQKTVQSINLIYFIPTACVALVTHIKADRVEKRTVRSIIPLGIVGAAAGSLLALGLDNGLLRTMFGWFLLLMGIREVWIGYQTGKKDKSDK